MEDTNQLNQKQITISKSPEISQIDFPMTVINQLSALKSNVKPYRNILEKNTGFKHINYACVEINLLKKNGFWENYNIPYVFSNADSNQYEEITQNVPENLCPLYACVEVGRLFNDIKVKGMGSTQFLESDKFLNIPHEELANKLETLQKSQNLDQHIKNYIISDPKESIQSLVQDFKKLEFKTFGNNKNLQIKNNNQFPIQLRLANIFKDCYPLDIYKIANPKIIKQVFYENQTINPQSVFHSEASMMAWVYDFLHEKLKNNPFEGVVLSIYTEQAACDSCENIITKILQKVSNNFNNQRFFFPIIGYHKNTGTKRYVINEQLFEIQDKINHLGKDISFFMNSKKNLNLTYLQSISKEGNLESIVFDNILNMNSLKALSIHKWIFPELTHNKDDTKTIATTLQTRNSKIIEEFNAIQRQGNRATLQLSRLPLQIKIE